MIELSEKLFINADVQTVWAFLTDVEKSLSFNRFHVEIQLPNRFSVNNKSVISFSFRQSICVSSFLTYLNDKRKSSFPPNLVCKSVGIKTRKYEYL